LKGALSTPIIQKVILERFAHSFSVPTKNVDISSSWKRFFSIQPLQAITHNSVWYMYREEKIQSHIYGTIQYTFDIYGIVFSLPGKRYEFFPIYGFFSLRHFSHMVALSFGNMAFFAHGRFEF